MSDTPTPDTSQYIPCKDGSRLSHRWLFDKCILCGTGRNGPAPSAPPASARTVTRYHLGPAPVIYDMNDNGQWFEGETEVVLYAEVASLLTALAEAEQEIARLTAAR